MLRQHITLLLLAPRCISVHNVVAGELVTWPAVHLCATFITFSCSNKNRYEIECSFVSVV